MLNFEITIMILIYNYFQWQFIYNLINVIEFNLIGKKRCVKMLLTEIAQFKVKK